MAKGPRDEEDFSWSFRHFRAVVISDPQRISERHVSVDGFLGSFVVGGHVLPVGSVSMRTQYRRASEFWMRAASGQDIQVMLDRPSAPCIQGHVLTVVTAVSGRMEVLAGFINHQTGQYCQILPSDDVLRLLDIPEQERWTVTEDVPLRQIARTKRKRRAGMLWVWSLLVLGAAACVMGLAVGMARPNAVAAALLFGILPGLIAIIAAALVYNQLPEVQRTRSWNETDDVLEEFEEDYSEYLRGLASAGGTIPVAQPIVTQVRYPTPQLQESQN